MACVTFGLRLRWYWIARGESSNADGRRPRASPRFLRRKLTWIYTLGTAVLRGNFQSKPIEMQMNTLQAALCVLLNDVDELSYQEVRQEGLGPPGSVRSIGRHLYGIARQCIGVASQLLRG
jgi:hypothetical protein